MYNFLNIYNLRFQKVKHIDTSSNRAKIFSMLYEEEAIGIGL